MELKDNQQRAKWAKVVFIIFGIVIVLFALSGYSLLSVLDRIADGGDVSDAEANAVDMRHGLMAIFYMGAYIASVIAFILWFRRAYYNLHQITPETMSLTEGWAAGAWFVPFLNLVRPFHIMKEIWQETHGLIGSERKDRSEIVGLWWALYLIGNIFLNITSKMGDETSVDGLIKMTKFHNLGLLGLLPGLIIVIVVIDRVSKAEDVLYEKYHTLDITSHLVDDNSTKKAFD
jgi:hypothetical protein